MKITIPILAFLMATAAQAQVGINTDSPNATLDVVASSPTSPSSTDGFLPPRVSALPTGMTADQTGMMVYLTAELNASTPAGIYIYNGTEFLNIFESDLEKKSIVRGFLSADYFVNSPSGNQPFIYQKLPFDSEDFDTNDEFDTTTSTFTADRSGFYRVAAKASSNDYDGETVHGFAIYKNGSLISLSSFEHSNHANNGSNDTLERTISDILQLDAGETIEFYFSENFATLNSDKTSTYFTIEQVQ